MHDLCPQNRTEWRVFGRLQDHGASRGEGRNDLGRHLIHRPIPRRYESTNTHRLLDQPSVPAQFLEFEGLEDLDHGADMPYADARLRAFRKRDGRAHFGGYRECNFVVVGLVRGEHPLQEGESFDRGGP